MMLPQLHFRFPHSVIVSIFPLSKCMSHQRLALDRIHRRRDLLRERLHERVVNDAQLLHDDRPRLRVPPLDRQIRIVDERKPQHLVRKVHPQEPLLREPPLEPRVPDFAQHVRERGGRGAEDEHARVDVEREALVDVDVGDGGEGVREREELVDVLVDERVAVEVHAHLDPDRVERPEAQLGVLVRVAVEEGPVVWRCDALDGDELPACRLGKTDASLRNSVGEVEEEVARRRVYGGERLREGQDAGEVRVGIERRDDGALISGRRVRGDGVPLERHVRYVHRIDFISVCRVERTKHRREKDMIRTIYRGHQGYYLDPDRRACAKTRG